ncbi:MAG: iron ABC transporter permease [Pseudomonadota bacterium]
MEPGARTTGWLRRTADRGWATFAAGRDALVGRMPQPVGVAAGLRARRASMILLIGLIAFAFAVIGALYGAAPLSLSQLWTASVEAITGADPSDRAASAIFLHVRLPRMLLGAFVGAGLALAGCAMQGLFRNPLADPGLIGVTAGATVGAVTAIVLGGVLFAEAPDAFKPYAVPVMAFLGAALVTVLVFQVAGVARDHTGQGASVATLLLAGVAIQAIAAAGVAALAYISDDQQLRDLTFWSLGGLGGADWPSIIVAVTLIGIAAAAIIRRARALDLLQLGERAAFCSGVDVAREKLILGGFGALAVAAGVAVAGPIGFIGLVAPHMARLLVGPNHVYALPASALMGAALILAADLAVRTIVPPAEPPIGLATSLIGGPFFLYLLIRPSFRSARHA